MTKFRNTTDDTLDVPSLGVTVAPGDTTPELSKKEAEGFSGQSDVWAPVGGNAAPAKKAAAKKAAPKAQDAPPATEAEPSADGENKEQGS